MASRDGSPLKTRPAGVSKSPARSPTAQAAHYPGAQAITRAIAILKSFDDGMPEMSMAEISRRVGLHRSTTYRLLSALESEGFVAQDEATGRYRLGPELVVLGGIVLRNMDLRRQALPYLHKLAESSGETVDLDVLSGHEILTIEEIPGDHVLAASRDVGMRFPLHATSTGKVLLAYLSPSQRASLLPKSLPSYTTRTITDSAKLHAELDRVRAQGYAISNEELEEHLVAIGAPVRDHDGIVIAAISLSGPASRLPRERMSALIPQVMQTAEEISRVLGYR